ncbi:hypothetical protein Trco_000076 [Trichoderma cornu-damae]|uniref:F-box domain-containing protein n=1 Tax=Trichoderma cornu-damae TaxID=654480 RepID=A0A9P8TVZ7_9HYPO|nr:hypothetical protein Trco_000076 [Trichoderma cornu-damae]
MDSLPFELVSHILSNLPPADYKSARLTCRAFNDALAKPTFNTLATFIDPAFAQQTMERTAADLSRRPKSIWSPGCSVPAGLPVPQSFLFAMHVALRGTPCPGAASSRDSSFTAGNFGRSIGMDDLTEDLLRQAMFRYALYLSYTYGGEGEAPQLWVMNPKRWGQQR